MLALFLYDLAKFKTSKPKNGRAYSMYSNTQRASIRSFFRNHRRVSIYEAMSELNYNSRKFYYLYFYARTNSENILKCAISCHIDADLIIKELLPLINLTLDNPNNRNEIILDGIRKRQSVNEINTELKKAHEPLF